MFKIGRTLKVWIFWEGHKIFLNFVAFSEYPKFTAGSWEKEIILAGIFFFIFRPFFFCSTFSTCEKYLNKSIGPVVYIFVIYWVNHLAKKELPCLHKELFAHNSNRKTWWCDVLHLLYIIPYQSHTCSNWQSNNADLLSGFPFLGLLCLFATQFSTQNVPSNLTLNTCEACQFLTQC